jgi:hypothetical protein
LFSSIHKFMNKCLLCLRIQTTPKKPSALSKDSLVDEFELTVEYLPTFKVIKIITKGLLTMEANNQIVANALAAISQYGSKLVLVDDRKIKMGMKIANIYDLPELNQQLGIDKDIRVALLYTPTPEMEKIFKFYENRTYITDFRHHQVFTDESEALDWLSKKNHQRKISVSK